MSLKNDIHSIRNKLIDVTISTSTFFILFALVPSLSRYSLIGWNPVFAFHIGISVTVAILFLIRKKISLSIKAHAIFIVFLLIALVGIINFRTVGGAYMALVVVSLSTMIYGLRLGMVYSAVFVICFVIIGVLQILNIINPQVDFNEYVNHETTWIAQVSAYIFIIFILINSINLFYKYFINALNDANDKSKKLTKTLDSLLQSNKKYRSIFKGSNDGLLFVDENFKITNCNNSYLKLTGYELSELRGIDYKELMYIKETDWDSVFLKIASTQNNKAEVEIIRKDGEIIPVEVSTYITDYDDASYLWAVIRDLRERKSLENEVFSAMISAEENERERYAKELHDGLGPLLSTSMIYTHTIIEEKDMQLIQDYASRAYEILEDATKTVKDISNNLSPIILKEYGMVQAVRSFIEKAGHATQIKFTIKDELKTRLPETIEFTIYRTLVELINNSLKYSKAKELSISFLPLHQDGIFIQYQDNGQGFDYEKAIADKKGFGLFNLKNRIHKIGGEYIYRTSPGQGVQVSIKLTNQYI